MYSDDFFSCLGAHFGLITTMSMAPTNMPIQISQNNTNRVYLKEIKYKSDLKSLTGLASKTDHFDNVQAALWLNRSAFVLRLHRCFRCPENHEYFQLKLATFTFVNLICPVSTLCDGFVSSTITKASDADISIAERSIYCVVKRPFYTRA
jgi:hypothetical protein